MCKGASRAAAGGRLLTMQLQWRKCTANAFPGGGVLISEVIDESDLHFAKSSQWQSHIKLAQYSMQKSLECDSLLCDIILSIVEVRIGAEYLHRYPHHSKLGTRRGLLQECGGRGVSRVPVGGEGQHCACVTHTGVPVVCPLVSNQSHSYSCQSSLSLEDLDHISHSSHTPQTPIPAVYGTPYRPFPSAP
jgi:hypothetical protein